MNPRLCSTFLHLLYSLVVDVHVKSILLDVCGGLWFISSLSLYILEENNLCLLVLSNPLEVFSESDRFSILGQLELIWEYSIVNVKLFHEWVWRSGQTEPNPIHKDSIDCLTVIVLWVFKPSRLLLQMFKDLNHLLSAQISEYFDVFDLKYFSEKLFSCSSTKICVFVY